MLLQKEDKQVEHPSNYHSVCMLDTPGKLYELIIIANYIEEAIVKEKIELAVN